jgi:hypothetical protein
MDLPVIIGDECADPEEFLNDFCSDDVSFAFATGNSLTLHNFDRAYCMNTVEDFLKERQQIMVKAVIARGRNSHRVYLLRG